ncbi:MAG: NAD-dependent epimerase/dehydratase family protein [Alphaproteobacteria bacterium]|nr:NAD-dependent epimerase/dehydratase family protein [Alphaproteobacteria bacterium]
MAEQRRVCLVGAGNIANTHADALRAIPGVRIAAIVDPNRAVAERLAQRHAVSAIFATGEAAIAAGAADAAHILVPPDLHAAAARPWIDAGHAVLIEKPLTPTAAACRELEAAARASGATIGVNQNSCFHPAMRRLVAAVEGGGLGKLVHVNVVYGAPLRQLATRQFGHWMFARPGNILLEQAVHPLAQLRRLVGPCRLASASIGPSIEIAPGARFYRNWQIAVAGAESSGDIRLLFGADFPHWRVEAICDDGVAVADMFANHFIVHDRTRYLEAMDLALSGARRGLSMARQSIGGLVDYARAMVGLGPRADQFYRSMHGSIADFHAALDRKAVPQCSAAFGGELVALLEEARAAAGVEEPAPAAPIAKAGEAPRSWDVAVIGGTGFIGRYTVEALLRAGYSVGVMARSVRNLPSIYTDPRVAILRGDVTSREDVERVVRGARFVVNLAHGGASGGYEAIKRALVGSAAIVGEACLAHGTERLIHVSSIAALYLGDGAETITARTPADPKSDERGDYARAKAEADRLILDMIAQRKLPATIQRPGMVVGDGTSPFHSGLGFYNNDQHCIGWNDGRNPLPFVLAEDVASAIVAALTAPDVIGRADNIVGDVRLSAREFVAETARVLGRPLVFHPQSPLGLQAVEIVKWLVKRVGGRAAPFPSYRDILSRGMPARFDCGETKAVLGWKPCADRATFIARALGGPAAAPSEPTEIRPAA